MARVNRALPMLESRHLGVTCSDLPEGSGGFLGGETSRIMEQSEDTQWIQQLNMIE